MATTTTKQKPPQLARFDAVRLAKKFANPYCDDSDPRLWPEELAIIRRMLASEYGNRGHDDHLTESRHYIKEIKGCAVSWYWPIDKHPWSEQQYDAPVRRLMSRGVIRTVWCAGGYGWVVFTDHARKVLGIVEAA